MHSVKEGEGGECIGGEGKGGKGVVYSVQCVKGEGVTSSDSQGDPAWSGEASDKPGGGEGKGKGGREKEGKRKGRGEGKGG